MYDDFLYFCFGISKKVSGVRVFVGIYMMLIQRVLGQHLGGLDSLEREASVFRLGTSTRLLA